MTNMTPDPTMLRPRRTPLQVVAFWAALTVVWVVVGLRGDDRISLLSDPVLIASYVTIVPFLVHGFMYALKARLLLSEDAIQATDFRGRHTLFPRNESTRLEKTKSGRRTVYVLRLRSGEKVRLDSHVWRLDEADRLGQLEAGIGG